MKRMFQLFLALSAAAVLSLSCSGLFDFDTPEETVPRGISFYTNVQGLTFYFVDADGNDLIDNDERTTWPLSFPEKVEATTRESALRNASASTTADGHLYYLYNENSNLISRDEGLALWGFSTYLWGRTVEPQYTMFVYAGGGIDSLQVAYTYLSASEGTISSGWGVRVDSVKYNGVEVLVNNDNGKVFIQKPSQNETVVKVGQL